MSNKKAINTNEQDGKQDAEQTLLDLADEQHDANTATIDSTDHSSLKDVSEHGQRDGSFLHTHYGSHVTESNSDLNYNTNNPTAWKDDDSEPEAGSNVSAISTPTQDSAPQSQFNVADDGATSTPTLASAPSHSQQTIIADQNHHISADFNHANDNIEQPLGEQSTQVFAQDESFTTTVTNQNAATQQSDQVTDVNDSVDVNNDATAVDQIDSAVQGNEAMPDAVMNSNQHAVKQGFVATQEQLSEQAVNKAGHNDARIDGDHKLSEEIENVEASLEQPAVAEPLGAESLVDEAPIEQGLPVDELPVDEEPPVDEVPVDEEPPVDEIPVDEEPPVEEAPEEPVAEEPPPEDLTINGTNGNDTLSGGAGNDTISGGEGADEISGGEGMDTLLGQAGDDILYGNEGDDHLDGGGNNDKLYGGEGDDTLIGGAGNDVLDGGEGTNTMSGGAGNDILVGGEGGNTLDGGAGNDIMGSGAGDDTFIGGDGDDLFLFNAGDGQNTVDGGVGWTDKIQLNGVDGGPSESANLSEGSWALGVEDGVGYTLNADGSGLTFDSADASGTVTFADGTEVAFENVEQIVW